jgi:hypothetical protein
MKTRTITAALTALLLLGTVFATTSFADDGREVAKRGHCSAGAHWELDAEDEGARLELDFEVKTATAGQDWRVKLRHDGDVFARMTKTTHADGDFEVERHVTDTVGTDTLGARAVNLKTQQVCKARLSI